MKPEKFLKEAHLMKELDHPKVLKLLAIVTEEEPLMIVTEYLSNGDLKSFFGTDMGQMLDEYALHNISFQVEPYCRR